MYSYYSYLHTSIPAEPLRLTNKIKHSKITMSPTVYRGLFSSQFFFSAISASTSATSGERYGISWKKAIEIKIFPFKKKQFS